MTTTQIETTDKQDDRKVSFVPLGSEGQMTLTPKLVRDICARSPSTTGEKPGFEDVYRFMMLCKERKLNPLVGDAFLIGYNTKERQQGGGEKWVVQWTQITAIQALLKRAEAAQDYEGHEAGVVVLTEDGETRQRVGSIVLDGEKLIGGWAKIQRKDKSPLQTALPIGPFDSGKSRWRTDPGGMIRKVALAAGLREAFPLTMGGLYVQEEREDALRMARDVTPGTVADRMKDRERERLLPPEVLPKPTNTVRSLLLKHGVTTAEKAAECPLDREAREVADSCSIHLDDLLSDEERAGGATWNGLDDEKKAEVLKRWETTAAPEPAAV